MHLPIQDAAPEFSDAAEVQAAQPSPTEAESATTSPAQAAAAENPPVKPTLKPATRQPAKPRTRPIDKQADPIGDEAASRDGDTHD